MDSLNFTIDGDLGLPGFVRVPPPFGTRRDAVRAIHATLARVEDEARLATAAVERHALRARWRQRLTVVAIGVACTAVAALIGLHTGKRQHPLPHVDQVQHAAIAQVPTPSASPEVFATDTAPAVAAGATADRLEAAAGKTEAVPAVTAAATPQTQAAPAPALSKPLATATKPRTLARGAGRTAAPVTPARPAARTYDAPVAIESYGALDDATPATSGFVTPGTSAHIELQRHTRLTD
ncbi:hypothetical protein [Ralstonia sp. 24A2]|uniref:hypothetical protein n=1 Tax=Ralstonia sp. 24A2 TaxID=3447364 RepID=UPI003F69FCAC